MEAKAVTDKPRLIERAFPLKPRRWIQYLRRMSATGISPPCTSGLNGDRSARAGLGFICFMKPSL